MRASLDEYHQKAVRAALGEAGLAVWLKRWKSILFEAVILCVGEGGS